MSASNREASISKTLTYEGGYTNNRNDPGGATNWGITITDARLYWKHDASPADVKAMPKHVAIDIYRQKYWAKMGCDDRPAGPDFVDFDFGVNSGTARAIKLRRTLGPQKLSPINYVKAQTKARMSFLTNLRTFKFFGKGWSSRVANVQATGVRMAVEAAGKPVGPSMKKRANEANAKASTHTTAATGAAVGTGFLHHLTTLDTSTKVGLSVLGFAVILGAVYFIWHAVHNSHLAQAYAAQAALYKDQIPCEPTSPLSGPASNSNGTSLSSPSLQASPASLTGSALSTSSPSSSTLSPNQLPTS